ncbi:GNAT family N-acetyltransferase [Aquihabitans sp. G128]|uniref:GNAT family N-acetyltransferase n=1 Tax=Aquihabitans sp. G128 TaxID=2849779 RepID=UPI001C22F93E|nr:GNAT family N-acetyltransferase [Aquihabitans sp. G128]QXC61874.1 GNAT family N-acetyltransferase [Aquihabitans sp. G128]
MALRPWGAQASDAATLAAAWSEPDIARWTAVPDAHDEAAAARWVAGEGARRDQGVALDLAITESGVPEVVLGEIGLALVEADRRWAEVGYWLFPAERGRGRASVALEVFTDWVLRDLPINRLFARTHVDNPASAAVARRAGYELAGELPDGAQVWVADREG